MSSRFIGVFDSGLGGLNSVKEIIRQLPDENIVFFGDTANMPYGDKTREEIISFTKNSISFLSRYDLKAFLIACNTSDSNASKTVKTCFDLPIFGVISPAAKKAVSISENGKIGILATVSTIASGEYVRRLKELNENIEVFPMACEKLVPLIEEGKFLNDDGSLRKAIDEYLDPLLEKGIDTLILGCTHYDLIEDLILEKAPDLKIVSSSVSAVDDIREYLEKNGEREKSNDPKRIYFVSKDPEHFEKIARNIIEDISIKKSN